MSASVECEHEHIVLINSLLDLYEHGGDTDGLRYLVIPLHKDSMLRSDIELSPHSRRLASLLARAFDAG